jgi:hypothetical protein
VAAALDLHRHEAVVEHSAGRRQVLRSGGGDLFRRVALGTARSRHSRVQATTPRPAGDLGVIASCVMAAEIVLVPVSLSGLNVNRIQPTWKLLAELEPSTR